MVEARATWKQPLVVVPATMMLGAALWLFSVGWRTGLIIDTVEKLDNSVSSLQRTATSLETAMVRTTDRMDMIVTELKRMEDNRPTRDEIYKIIADKTDAFIVRYIDPLRAEVESQRREIEGLKREQK